MRAGADNPDVLVDLAGQIAGLVDQITPAAAVVRGMVAEAQAIITRLSSSLKKLTTLE